MNPVNKVVNGLQERLGSERLLQKVGFLARPIDLLDHSAIFELLQRIPADKQDRHIGSKLFQLTNTFWAAWTP